MANQVYANDRELACAAGAGKTICSMPDVCFTPPENPATPPGVPVPYPNTGLASDTTDGSKSVQISGKEVMMKDKSSFKKSTGDEAGCAAKKGVITSTNTGPVYFTAWSMDVKVEGENAVRHLDMTTGNHGSPAATASVPWPFTDGMSKADKAKCAKDKANEKKACKDYKPHKEDGKDVCDEAKLSGAFTYDKGATTKRTMSANENDCAAARRCQLLPYNASPRNGHDGCCPSQTGDHVIPKSSFFVKAVNDGNGKRMKGWGESPGKTGYDINAAPCMCLEGGSNSGSHGDRHAYHKASGTVDPGKPISFADEADACAESAHAVAPQCSKACIKAQLEQGHKGMGDTSGDVKHSPTGKNYEGDTDAVLENIEKTGPPPR